MTTTMIEIQRNNVTVSEFLSYIKSQCRKKGITFDFDRENFENPTKEYGKGYIVIDGKKKCHFSEYRMVTKYLRKQKYYDLLGGKVRVVLAPEFEEFQEKELYTHDSEEDAIDAPCKSEETRNFAYDYQTYILNFDGTLYNEICEFTFDTDNRGHGYYYQVNKMQEEQEAELSA